MQGHRISAGTGKWISGLTHPQMGSTPLPHPQTWTGHLIYRVPSGPLEPGQPTPIKDTLALRTCTPSALARRARVPTWNFALQHWDRPGPGLLNEACEVRFAPSAFFPGSSPHTPTSIHRTIHDVPSADVENSASQRCSTTAPWIDLCMHMSDHRLGGLGSVTCLT